MTRTQFTDARRNIRKQIISWISIVVIGMVALIAYLSLVYSSEAIRRSISDYYERYRFWDLEVTSTMLMDEDDLAAIRALPGVELAEPVWRSEAVLPLGETETAVAVQSLSGEISLPELLEGSLPAKAGECAVEQRLQDTLGLSPGQQIRVESSPVAGVDPLAVKTYTITGVFRHPDHISYEIQETPYVLVTQDCFDPDALRGAFMKTRIRVAGGAPEGRYSEEYRSRVRTVCRALQELEAERTASREEKIRTVYTDQLDSGQEKLDDAEQELREAEEKLADGRKQLDAGWAELKRAEQQLIDMKQKLDDGGRALGEAEYQLAAVPPWLAAVEQSFDDADDGDDPDESGGDSDELGSLVGQYRDGKRSYSEGRAAWYAAGEEYLDGLTLYDRNRKKLEQGEADYAAALEEYETGKASFDEGARQLDGLREQSEAVGTCRWLILNDNGNAGYVFAASQADGLSAMSYSVSLIFLVIAALVIYATVGRMVQEQRALIGTSKALGLYNREILGKYMFFGVSAGVTAAVLGVAASYFPVQRAMLSNYIPFFTFRSIPPCFMPLETAIVVAAVPLLAAVSVWFACRGLIRIPAIRLLQGGDLQKKRRSSRRKSARGLYSRLIFRNMQTDMSRVLVTIVSIAGCCMTLMCGFAIKFAIDRVSDRQFGEVIRFQAEVYFDPSAPEAGDEIARILEDNGMPHVLVRRAACIFQTGENLNNATAIAAEPGSLDGYYGLKDPGSGEMLQPTDDGVLIPSRLSVYAGIRQGDKLLTYDASLKLNEVPVTGIFTNHFGYLLFFTPTGYENVFGTKAEGNCFLVRMESGDLEGLEELVGGVAGFERVRDAAAERERFNSFSSIINVIVIMLLVLAGVMAYFIVMNLSVTYIQKKTRELTIMRINGFTVRECVIYVSWDLVVTTLLGVLVGLIVGHFLSQAVLPVAEGPYMQFVHDPDLRTYLFPALITMGFSALISSAALRRVKYLKLSDVI